MADEQKNIPSAMNEADIPAEWHDVTQEPINPANRPAGAPPQPNDVPPYFRAVLNPDMQHDAHFVGTSRITPQIPVTPLMPSAPSANPQINAAIQSSIIENTVKTTTLPAQLAFKGVWLSFVNYITGNIVLFNSSTYIAITGSNNVQPDLNPANWTLLSENLVFNTAFSPTQGAGIGPIIGSIVTAHGAAGPLSIVGTPSVIHPNMIAVVQINLDNGSSALSAVPSGWTLLYNTSTSVQFYYRAFTGGSPTFTSTLTIDCAWQATMAFFEFGNFTSFNITQVSRAGTTVTVTANNTLVAGNVVGFAGLTNATFLNGQIGVVLTASSTQFTLTLGSGSYGPTADTGTATLAILQVTSQSSGAGGSYSKTFSNPIGTRSVFMAHEISAGAAYTGATFTSVSDDNGNTYTIGNANGGAGVGIASIAYSTPNTSSAHSTPTISVTATGSFLNASWYAFELPGGSNTTITFLPYDVLEFRGSFFVCLKETQLDAFSDPASWGQIAQGTGTINEEISTYTAVAQDYGRLITFNSSSAVTLNLPATPPSLTVPQSSGWWVAVENTGTGVLTVNRNGHNIDGVATNLILGQNQGMLVFTDGSNYFTLRGSGSTSGGVNSQTISYTPVSSDSGKLISMNGANLTLTLPNPAISTAWYIAVENLNSTNLTISRNSLTIDGAASNLTLGQNQGVVIYSDGTNYFTLHGMNSLVMPSIFLVTGPDGSGQTTVTLATEVANTAWRGPVSGAAAQPTFRLDVPADLPGYVLATGVNVTTSQSGNLRPGGVVAPAGMYRVSVYLVLTANPSVGTLQAGVGWDDGTLSQLWSPASISTAVLGNALESDVRVVADGVHDIIWSTTLT